MRTLGPFVAALLMMSAANTASANAGGPGLLTLDGLPPDIVFTEGVPQEVTVSLRAFKHTSSALCHGEAWAQITIPDVVEAVAPCYGSDYDTAVPSAPDFDGGACFAGVGTDTSEYTLGGGGFPTAGDQTFEVTLRYDGSTPVVRDGEWILLSDGECNDVSDPDYRRVGSINIHILAAGESHEDGFIASAVSPNFNHFLIDHPELNGNPNATVIVTPLASYETPTATNHGVWYTGGANGRWSVYREDGSAMPVGADFVVALGGPRGFVHETSAANISSFVTYLDDDRLNDNPYAAPFVTHTWNPPGAAGQYHDHAVGVFYNPFNGRWMAYNEDMAPMSTGVNFNVVVASDWTGGGTEEVGRWPTTSPGFSETAPAVLSHHYVYPGSTFRPAPVSFLTETWFCLPPPFSNCSSVSGPADSSGMFEDDTRFFAWVPFAVQG